jgi:signal transduction histidine kinase/CheY-like chemotaxis protein
MASLVLAIVISVLGLFSVYAWIAVVLILIPVLFKIKVFQNKLTYDQKIYIQENFLLLSSLFWGFYMWSSLQHNAGYFTLVFVVLSVAALLCLREIKSVFYTIIPLLIVDVVLLMFFENPARTELAILTIIFTALLFVFTYYKDEVVVKKASKLSDSKSQSGKMELVTQVDDMKTANQELTNQIKQIESELSAASMAKMEFLATMSHEIRTPLNGIIPLLDILLDSELSDFQKDYLSTAHVSAIQMQKLIDDLLDYSKVEAGKLSVEVRGIKILRLMDSIKATYQKAADNKNISLVVKINNNVSPLLRGDPTRIRQVLSNLISNAIKFSSGGTVKISAKKLKDFHDKEVIRFSVADQGIGLDQETMENIFLPFTQEDGSSTRKFGGTGLGLAISKKIVELMHGTIGLKSEKNRGSTFFFDLPLLKSVGETQSGITSSSSFQAIIINTNPLLFNKVSKDLKGINVNFQKALGLTQAYEIYESINKNSDNTKNVIMLLDFETAGKQVRSLCEDLEKDNKMDNLHVLILTENKNIAGIPSLKNVKLLSKHDDIEEHLNRIEVMQAAQESIAEEVKASVNTGKVTEDPKEIENIIPEILLVEDNEINLKVAEKLIQYIGYPFDIAMNGQEALEKVKQNRYRMILMDCQMPVMDGYKCTARVRDYETAAGLNHTPILAMTANAMMGDREKCLDAGMDDYMSKPLNRYILEKTLKKWDPLILNKAPSKIQPVQSNITETIQSESSSDKPATSTTENNLGSINSKWLNVKALEEIQEFMGEEIHQLLEMFEQETPKILSSIREGLKNKDHDVVKKKAHMLKSTSANIGANGLSFFSRKMEVAATNKNAISNLVTIFTKLTKAYIITKKEIKKYIKIINPEV